MASNGIIPRGSKALWEELMFLWTGNYLDTLSGGEAVRSRVMEGCRSRIEGGDPLRKKEIRDEVSCLGNMSNLARMDIGGDVSEMCRGKGVKSKYGWSRGRRTR